MDLESFGSKKRVTLELTNRINQNKEDIVTYRAEIEEAKRQMAEIEKTAGKYEHAEAKQTAEQMLGNLRDTIASHELMIKEAEEHIADYQSQLLEEMEDTGSKPN